MLRRLQQSDVVLLSGGVGKLLKIGKQAINVRKEVCYNPGQPDNAPDWTRGGSQCSFYFQKIVGLHTTK